MSRQPFHLPESKPLQIVALASMLIGVMFIAGAFIPGFSNFPVGQKSLGWNELWHTRVAVAVLVGGLFMLAFGFGVVRRQAWTRIALVVLPVLQCLPFEITHVIWGAPNPLPFDEGNLLGILIWAVICSIYLFGFKAARDHYKVQSPATAGR
ncbi:hypothetical protein [Dyella sp.]|uniref:hypothetical protein n=1 Tax=Dyella sp. TaxID=1869338 RepID=UPI002FD97077